MPKNLRIRIVRSCAILLLAGTAPAVYAQDTTVPTRNNAAYFELLGSGGLYSINYERALAPSVRVRVGAAVWTAESFWGGSQTEIRTFPVMLHLLPGRGAHRLEAGLGVLPGNRGRDAGDSGGFVSLLGLVGYRYEPPQRRFTFRAGFTPFYGFGESSVAYPDSGFLPSFGVSWGARF
jgi:hypothetical protein